MSRLRSVAIALALMAMAPATTSGADQARGPMASAVDHGDLRTRPIDRRDRNREQRRSDETRDERRRRKSKRSPAARRVNSKRGG